MNVQMFFVFSASGSARRDFHTLGWKHSAARVLLLGATMCVFSLSARAQEQAPLPPDFSESQETDLFEAIPSVETVSKYKQPVQGASKEEQRVTEAPSSITIITADEIKKFGHRTLADVLQGVNGFYVTNDRQYSYVGVRGFNRPGDFNSRILLLVDGHRLNDNLYDQASIATESPIDVDLIDRVEVIRGPSSSLYGTNAFFGVINVIMKRGRDINGLEVSSERGSHDSYKGRGTYGKRFANGLEVLLSGAFYDSQGHERLYFKEFDTPATNNGIVRGGDDDRFPSLFAKLSWSDFTLHGGFHSREKGIPTASYGTVFNTRRTRSVDERGYFDLKYEHEFTHKIELKARVYYDRFYYRGDYLYDYAEAEGSRSVLNQDVSVGEWWGGDVQATRRFFDKHKITLGMDFRDNVRQSLQNHDTEPFTRYLDDRRSSRNWAFYLQDEFSIRDNLLLNAGVRYDHYDSFGGTVNPRLALIYTLPKTSLKLLYGRAFRAPSVYEHFYVGTGFKANPSLQPETIEMYELILERYLGQHLRASASAYYYTIDDLISQQADLKDGLLVFQNAQEVTAKGLEFDLEGKWADNWEGQLSYAIQNAQDQSGKNLTNSPQHMVKFNLIVPVIRERLFAALETRYLSDRGTHVGKSTGDHFVANVTLFSQGFFKGMELSGSIYNVFDADYGDPGSGEHRQRLIEQDGRTFWLKLKYAF